MENALPPIPAKRYFTIGEVSELCGVKPYVLRYWEQEFSQLKPMKRRGNRRYYQHHEVLLIRRIRELLYDQGFTISGARNQLGDPLSPRGSADTDAAPDGADSDPDTADDAGAEGEEPEQVLQAGAAGQGGALGVATAGATAGTTAGTAEDSAALPAPHGAGRLAPGELRAALRSIRALLAV